MGDFPGEMPFMRFQEGAMTLDLIAVAEEGQIAAGRFVLRHVRRSDAGLFAMYAGDRRVAEATHSIPHPLPPGAAEAFVARAMAGKADEEIWVMDGSATGLAEVLGVISLKRMDRAQSEIGYWVAPAFWNTGIASEAVKALVEANPQKNRTIFAEVFQDNPGSARVLTNAGFQYLGDAETFSVARNARVPTWTYVKKLD
jgi:RimJ/RimL family protein N-acetyltransferase